MILLLLLLSQAAYAWDNHALLTRLSLAGWDNWEKADFEPLERVLPVLNIGGVRPSTREGLFKALEIRGDRVKWDEPGPQPQGADSAALAVLAWATDHPDHGMDQEMHLTPDQEWMGGYTGLSSQAFRHMYFLPWDWKQPLITMHLPHPAQAMGQAPDRAQIFFDMAVQARRGGHHYWAYRFLGMGLHYIQDLNQPYHCQQVGSLVLLPYGRILRGKAEFLKEATRIISNMHLAFEQQTLLYLNKARLSDGKDKFYRKATDAFRVPTASLLLKNALQNNLDLPVRDAAVLMTRAGAMLTPQVVREQLALMEKDLVRPGLDLGAGFTDENGVPKLDFESIEASPSTGTLRKREQLLVVMAQALSNTGMSTRWVFDKFRLLGR